MQHLCDWVKGHSISVSYIYIHNSTTYKCTSFGSDSQNWSASTITLAPVKQRIQYKLGLLVYRCLHSLAPPYLSSLPTPVSSNEYSGRLRSAFRGNLTVPRTRSVRMGPRSFAVSGPELWNFLAPELENPSISLNTFKSLLKTELFKRAYLVA